MKSFYCFFIVIHDQYNMTIHIDEHNSGLVGEIDSKI